MIWVSVSYAIDWLACYFFLEKEQNKPFLKLDWNKILNFWVQTWNQDTHVVPWIHTGNTANDTNDKSITDGKHE